MSNFFGSFARFGGFFIFMFLEIVCFILIIRYNESQRTIFLHSSSLFSGFLLEKYSGTVAYLNLKEVSDNLAASNAALLERLSKEALSENVVSDKDTVQMFPDSSIYAVYPAQIINNSIGRNHNYLTLNRGASDGLKPDLGVISDQGLVGIIKNVSTDYALVMSLLHRQMRLSAAIKRSGYFGTLVWKTGDPRFMILEEVPKHADVQKGDTIVTSGFSAIFPPDIVIGKVEEFKIDPSGNAYIIKVRLNENMGNLRYAYVIEHKQKQQIEELENQVQNE